MNELVYVLVGVIATAFVGGYFAYLRGSPNRTEVKEMIEIAVKPMTKSIDESTAQSKQNTSMIIMIQASVQDTNHNLGLMKKDFEHIQKSVDDTKRTASTLLENWAKDKVR